MAEKKKETLTTASRSPVADNQNSLTAGSDLDRHCDHGHAHVC
jgi:catalase